MIKFLFFWDGHYSNGWQDLVGFLAIIIVSNSETNVPKTQLVGYC